VWLCHGWNYKTFSDYGPTSWPTYFPHCDATSQVQSPIAFTTGERTATTAAEFTWGFHRLITPTTTGINFQTTLNAGGLLHAYPLAAFPLTLQRMSTSSGAVVNQSTVYLLEIAYHTQAEHTGAIAETVSGEVQYVFGDTAGGAPSLVFAQPIVATTAATVAADTSIAMTLLSYVTSYVSTTQSGASTLNYITPTMPYLFLNNTNALSTRAMSYYGTTTWPPCSPVRVVVSLTRAMIPATLFTTLYSASNKVFTARAVQARPVSMPAVTYLQVQQGNALDANNIPLNTPAPTQYVDVTVVVRVPNRHNEYMMDAIIGLVALNGVLLIAIAVILLARWEVIEWPMWLGGLRRPVEWWTNPQSTGADGENDEDEEDEEDEEGEEGEEGEHEYAEEDEQALRAHAA
ncbi:transmembrane protein, putative, partial [Bodo saltans]